MSAHLAKVRAHAERVLGSPPEVALVGLADAPALDALRRFLKVEDHRLRLQHRAGESGAALARRRAGMVDVFLTRLFESACAHFGLEGAERPTLVALGGYGRNEVCPHSDIDVLFLHGAGGDDPPPAVGELVQQLLYQLWDLGFRVGHSTRSLGGATRHANTDLIFKTSLLEARRVAGDEGTWAAFERVFPGECLRGREEEYFEWRVADTASRRRKHGPTVFLQEPQVKWSPGGLRDFHNVLWCAQFTPHRDAVRRGGLEALVGAGVLEPGEWRALETARDFLLRVRHELHYLDGRAADSLSLHHQPQVAARLRVPGPNELRRNEALMKEYYRHARDLHLIGGQLFEELRRSVPAAPPPAGAGRFERYLAAGPPPSPDYDGFYSRGGLIYPRNRHVFNEDRLRMLRVFHHAQERGEDLSPELFQLIRQRRRLVTQTFRYGTAPREVFFEILGHKGKAARILRMMHETGVLGSYLPEFGALFCLVQHEFFHRYTTDEHTLVCLEKLDALASTTDPRLAEYRRLFEDLDDPFTLYLAIILHDTGKATAARHHAEASALFAQKTAARLSLRPERRRDLVFLVDHHLTLSNMAQRRNVDDPATIREFAEIVGTRERLDMLMLLTLADGQGTGDENWSDWKESLVWQMHRRTAEFLREGETFARLARRRREQTANEVRGLLGPSFGDEVEAHLFHMPDRYFRSHGPEMIADHLRLLRTFLLKTESLAPSDMLAPAVAWADRPESGHTEVGIWNWERADLLPKVAGSFAAAGLNILGADFYRREDALAFYLFRVSAPGFRVVDDARDRKAFETTLASALQDLDSFDFRPLWLRSRRRREPMLAGIDFPTRITVTNPPTAESTLIELQTPDRLGLLYDLLDCFTELGVRVASSRVATQAGAAIDSFYLTDARTGGRLADRELLRRVGDAIKKITSR